MVCKKCGTENENRNVCSKCGNFIGKNKKIIDKNPESIKRRKKKKATEITKSILKTSILVSLAMLIVGTIIFLLTYYLIKSMDWSELEELNQSSTTTAQSSIESSVYKYGNKEIIL